MNGFAAFDGSAGEELDRARNQASVFLKDAEGRQLNRGTCKGKGGRKRKAIHSLKQYLHTFVGSATVHCRPYVAPESLHATINQARQGQLVRSDSVIVNGSKAAAAAKVDPRKDVQGHTAGLASPRHRHLPPPPSNVVPS
ncbi:hypothetical protein MRX96_047606 [Rhipicephalus microplus]